MAYLPLMVLRWRITFHPYPYLPVVAVVAAPLVAAALVVVFLEVVEFQVAAVVFQVAVVALLQVRNLQKDYPSYLWSDKHYILML